MFMNNMLAIFWGKKKRTKVTMIMSDLLSKYFYHFTHFFHMRCVLCHKKCVSLSLLFLLLDITAIVNKSTPTTLYSDNSTTSSVFGYIFIKLILAGLIWLKLILKLNYLYLVISLKVILIKSKNFYFF